MNTGIGLMIMILIVLAWHVCKEQKDEHDGKDEVFFWPDGTWHRCDIHEIDATIKAVADNGLGYSVLWFPEELDDEELNTEVFEIVGQ